MLVVIVGVVGMGVGGGLLLLTFKAFATARRGDIKHIVLLVSTLIFVMLMCLGLLVSSYLVK